MAPSILEPAAVPMADPRTGQRSRALVLLNRKARRAEVAGEAGLARLRAAGFELIEEAARQPTEVSQIIRRYRGQVDAVVVGGGDGTLSQAADGLVEAGLPLGILPLGTANDLARTLGLPIDPVAAADVIAAGHQRRIDLGWVNGTHFFNVAMIGLGVGVTRRLRREQKKKWGVLAYLFAAAQLVTHARPFRADIRTETEAIRVRTVQIAVGNGRHFGGGLTVDEAATIDDGVLHLISVEVERWWQLLGLIPALWRGRLRDERTVRMLVGREFTVTPARSRAMKLTADGEMSGRTPATFRLVPAALSVFVPAPGV